MKKRIIQAVLASLGVAAVQVATIEGIPEWAKVVCTAVAGIVGMLAPKPAPRVPDVTE